MVRSTDGMEYVYRVYDESGRGKIATPAALPTEMLFDETGKVYGEVLTFEDGQLIGGDMKPDEYITTEGIPSRAQTAGENMVRSEVLKISGRKIARNLQS